MRRLFDLPVMRNRDRPPPLRSGIAFDGGIVSRIERPSAVEQRFGSRLHVYDLEIASDDIESDACHNSCKHGGCFVFFHNVILAFCWGSAVKMND